MNSSTHSKDNAANFGGILMPSILELLRFGLVAGLSLGTIVGAFMGWKYVTAGFPLAVWIEVQDNINLGTLGAVTFLLFWWALFWSFRRVGLSLRLVNLLACAVACVPFFLFAGYELNRLQRNNPSELLSLVPSVLFFNAKVAAGLVVVYALIAASVHYWMKRRLAAGRYASPKLFAAFLALLLLVNMAATGVTQISSADQRGGFDVIVILVDALRGDHVGSYGYRRDTTPEIDTFAKDAVVFLETISQSTFTKASIASLFTSKLVSEHGVYGESRPNAQGRRVTDKLAMRETTLAEKLLEHGFYTSAWVKNPHLRSNTGFAQGFVDFNEYEQSIESTNRKFIHWIKTRASPYRFFSYLHYLDLHDPYRPKPPFDTLFGTYSDGYADMDLRNWGDYLHKIEEGEVKLSPEDVQQFKAYYDGQLRYMDERIGQLFAALKKAGRYDNSLIILTADHGDGFMEHGFLGHARVPYEELIRVPLIVKFPGSWQAGTAITEQVRLIDVFPTILDMANIPQLKDIRGCSLVQILTKKANTDCFEYAVTEIGFPDTKVAVRTPQYKYIHYPQRPGEFYDLTVDPGEKHNLIDRDNVKKEELRRVALAVVENRKRSEETVTLDPDAIEKLKALGYIE